MERKHYIYRLTSPSGRSYIGLTGRSVKERWQKHGRTAQSCKGRHPLYDAMRKYGIDSFLVETIACTYGLIDAQYLERLFISVNEKGYNILPGGETGSGPAKVFWQQIKADPLAYEAYRQKLRNAQAIRIANGEDATPRIEGARRWRENNTRESYRLAMRGLRIAKKKNTVTGVKEAERIAQAAKPLKERLLEKHKGRYLARSRGVASVWASRSETEKLTVAGKISVTLKKYYENGDRVDREQLERARSAIDRSKQAPAASKGLKKFWEDLKKDPVRYKDYIERRKQTLKATNASKNI